MADEETKTRRTEFELKAAQPPDPIYYRIESDANRDSAALLRTPFERSSAPINGSRAARLMQ
jgi:hypothetical protein